MLVNPCETCEKKMNGCETACDSLTSFLEDKYWLKRVKDGDIKVNRKYLKRPNFDSVRDELRELRKAKVI